MTPAAAKHLVFWVILVIAAILLTRFEHQARSKAALIRYDRAFSICATAIRNSSSDPIAVFVPRIEPKENRNEIVFSWNWKSILIQMPEDGLRVAPYSGACKVNKKTQQLVSVFLMGTD